MIIFYPYYDIITIQMIKRIASSVLAVLIIATLASFVIVYGRGFRLNFNNKTITSTGILSASSYPDKASVWIDGQLRSATSTSLSLNPGWYNVKITKEGYQPWEQKIHIQGEILSQIDSLLIPTNPSLKTLTVTGVNHPSLSPAGTRVAYMITPREATASGSLKLKTGIYVFELRTDALGNLVEPKPLYQPAVNLDWQNARLSWSPDEKNILLTFTKTVKTKEQIVQVYLLDTESSQNVPLDVTARYKAILDDWQDLVKIKETAKISTLPESVLNTLSAKAGYLKMSPDDAKLLYLATSSATLAPVISPPLIGSNPTVETRSIQSGNYYVYDKKEDKNYFIASQKSLGQPTSITWYTDSKHIVIVENVTIYIMDYDGTNKRGVYSGPFLNNLVYPWPGGNRLVILTNLNHLEGSPNLYQIDLR